MRKEDFYDVFEYGDRLEPGVELKIEHSITMEYDTPDLTPFTNSDVKELESLRKISAGTELERTAVEVGTAGGTYKTAGSGYSISENA